MISPLAVRLPPFMCILVTQNSRKWENCNEVQMQSNRTYFDITVPAATGYQF